MRAEPVLLLSLGGCGADCSLQQQQRAVQPPDLSHLHVSANSIPGACEPRLQGLHSPGTSQAGRCPWRRGLMPPAHALSTVCYAREWPYTSIGPHAFIHALVYTLRWLCRWLFFASYMQASQLAPGPSTASGLQGRRCRDVQDGGRPQHRDW